MVRSGSPLAFHCKGYKALGFKKDIFVFMAGFKEDTVTSKIPGKDVEAGSYFNTQLLGRWKDVL